jgi:CheY-like chemotaxis protein
MLVRGILDADASRRAIEAIHRNADVQVALINDVLDVSRIVSGKLRLETKCLDAAACLRNALTAVRPAAAARQIDLVEDAPDPVLVMGDADRLQQVFWNLLSNAVKFTPSGGRVTITLREVNGEAVIRVSDTGAGIAPEFLPRVFDRFSQADPSPARTHGGLGIGLAIVRHLVELHGGRVLAESEGVGRGAAFTVWLPTAAVPRDAREWLEGSEFGRRVLASKEPNLGGLKVLVVDDEADARDLLATLLRSYGADVQAAANASDAVAAVTAWRPDVLLSDIAMPGEDGYELGRRLRRLPPRDGGLTPAIAVTAYGRAQDRLDALTAGYQEHVPKPVVPLELAAMVEMLARGGTRI